MKFIIGADECGTGAIAGPVVVCAFAAPLLWRGISGLTDSKRVRTQTRREDIAKRLMSLNYAFWIASRTNSYVDNFGLTVALHEAYVEAVSQVAERCCGVCRVVIDGQNNYIHSLVLPKHVRVATMPQADLRCPAVSAASIIGKVFRDQIMDELHHSLPHYNFVHNKGYPSKEHMRALEKHGVSSQHRKSYGPVAKVLRSMNASSN